MLLLAATGLAALGLGSGGAQASRASTGYQDGMFSSSAPGGYPAAPAAAAANATLHYRFTVTSNFILGSGTPAGRVYRQRITSVDGTDVSSGDPALTEDEVLRGATTGSPPTSFPLDPHQINALIVPGSHDYDESVDVLGCGYWAIWVQDAQSAPDVHGAPAVVLNAGVARVACGRPTPSVPAAPTPPAAAHAQTRPVPPHAAVTPSPAPTTSPSPVAAATGGPASPSPVALAVRPISTPLANGPIPASPPPNNDPIAANIFNSGVRRGGVSLALGVVGMGTVVGGAALGPAVVAIRRRRRGPTLAPAATPPAAGPGAGTSGTGTSGAGTGGGGKSGGGRSGGEAGGGVSGPGGRR